MILKHGKDDKNQCWCRKTVFDDIEGKNKVLTKEDLDILKRIERGQYPDAAFDPYAVSFKGKLTVD
jgi:hypothetical protein